MSDSEISRYDARVPGVDIPDAQKEERQQRHEFKQERIGHRRTGRNRGVVFAGRAGAALDRIFGAREETTS